MKSFATIQNATSGVRELRADRQISPREPVIVTLKPREDFGGNLEAHAHIIKTLANVEKLFVDPKANRPSGSASTIIGKLQIFIHDVVDDTAEKERLETNLKDIEKEIAICYKKLGNEKFVSRAPAKVVEEQKKRKEKYEGQREAVIKALKDLA
jgi:valyl-tRNA synthetase